MSHADTAPHRLGAAAVAAAYETGTLTPTVLVRHLLDRAGRLDPKIHAFIRLDAEAALEAAAQAEREIAAGRKRGPLHGVPVGIKDIIDVAGLPTTGHSKILLDNIAARDATTVSRLRAAGAIILGKLSTHEFAIGGPCHDLPFPAARNPWNTDHHPGGSSSGSGAGLAAGLFPLALGTDTGGSVRNPASQCGITGLKPTYGLVSRAGVFPLAFTLDHIGPMARSAEDAALLLEAIAGHDPKDPGSATPPAAEYRPGPASSLKGLRVGFVRHFHERDMPADPEMAAGLERAAEWLGALGMRVRDVTLPSLDEFAAVNRVILHAEAFAIHARWLRERPGDYAQLTRSSLLTGAFLTAEDLGRAQRARHRMIAAVEEAFREVDVLLCASSMDPAARIDDPAEIARTYARQARTPFNVTGHPALAVMTGLSSGGLPLAAQLVGRYFDERRLFTLAAAVAGVTGNPACPMLLED
ncbi:Asp-tRNA(Asn)/Glu-tRNA(Gln) amidotransferase GatCAB subunit A [Roseomonas gilardii]|uniref:Asp-tRNA(Asn)/Glu-tRNA(Gln) amidotransferase GatCAB subunit A n=1 Tax=Roseomonas gilardii TaxID=257708 RepID=UPI0004B3AEE0|nr:Asp-tRNA(Asn)/Glu-tRNA(Gln) amidotransferase GatCAB subunit A [Roseomonas gilardii]SUE42839.1 Glutamyl-tRNA(Gln) amidotransferase subunit A [Roseomonas gilardii subsp. rosea]